MKQRILGLMGLLTIGFVVFASCSKTREQVLEEYVQEGYTFLPNLGQKAHAQESYVVMVDAEGNYFVDEMAGKTPLFSRSQSARKACSFYIDGKSSWCKYVISENPCEEFHLVDSIKEPVAQYAVDAHTVALKYFDQQNQDTLLFVLRDNSLYYVGRSAKGFDITMPRKQVMDVKVKDYFPEVRVNGVILFGELSTTLQFDLAQRRNAVTEVSVFDTIYTENTAEVRDSEWLLKLYKKKAMNLVKARTKQVIGRSFTTRFDENTVSPVSHIPYVKRHQVSYKFVSETEVKIMEVVEELQHGTEITDVKKKVKDYYYRFYTPNKLVFSTNPSVFDNSQKGLNIDDAMTHLKTGNILYTLDK